MCNEEQDNKTTGNEGDRFDSHEAMALPMHRA
jgi:hypothetical protein